MGGWGAHSGAESRWRKTVQRSQRSARGDRGSVGRPQRHALSGCGMTAQAQLVLDARAAMGRSVQVIKPFKHSSTHPQAFYANSLDELTTVYHCFCWTLIALILPPLRLFLPSSLLSFLSLSLKYPACSCAHCPSFFLANPRLHLFAPLVLFFFLPSLHIHTCLRMLS